MKVVLKKGAVCRYVGSANKINTLKVMITGYTIGEPLIVLRKHQFFKSFDNRKEKGRYAVVYYVKGMKCLGMVNGCNLKQYAHDREF